MITYAYTLYDRKALTYSPPFFMAADGLAIRALTDLVGDLNTSVGRHPGDYVLYRTGRFDDASGQLLPDPVCTHIVDALACVPPAPRAFNFDRPPATDTRANGAAKE